MEGLSESSPLICNPSVGITNAMRRTGDLLLQSPWTFINSDRILKVWNVCDLSQFQPLAAPSSFPVCNLESDTATRWIYLCKNRDQMTDGLPSIFQPTRARRYAGKTESKNCNYFPSPDDRKLRDLDISICCFHWKFLWLTSSSFNLCNQSGAKVVSSTISS